MQRLRQWFLGLGFLIWALQTLAESVRIGDIQVIDVTGIKNYSQYVGIKTFAGNKVGFGGATEGSAMAWLKSHGFTTVINLRVAETEGEFDAESAAARAAGLNYVELPLDPRNPAPGVVDEFLRVAGDKLNRPVYIHCNSASRVAAMWMLGRVKVDGLERSAAEAEVEVIAEKPQDAIAFATAYLVADDK